MTPRPKMTALFVLITILLKVGVIAENFEIDEHGNIISGYSSAVHERGWVSETITDHKIITKNHNITAYLDPHRNFPNKLTLTFVTPWNPNGYKWSKQYAHKFSHISPVWFDIEPMPGSSAIPSFVLQGDANAVSQSQWMTDVRTQNPRVHIIPRYTLTQQHWPMEVVQKFLSNKEQQKAFLRTLAKSVGDKTRGFDGCVLEITPILNFVAHAEQQFNAQQLSQKEYGRIKKKVFNVVWC